MLTKPWLIAALRKSIKVKNKLFFESNWPKYKIYRNKLTTLIRLSKQRHYQRFFDSNIKMRNRNGKVLMKYWEMRRRGKKSKRINFIRSNGHSVLSDDPKTIGNTLNKYFSSIGHQLATDIPEVNTTFSDYLDPPLQNSFYFDPIIPQEIETEINLLLYNKALWLYSTPVKLLKLAKTVISKSLSKSYLSH